MEDNIAVRQNDGWPETAQPLQHFERAREQPLGERITREEGRQRQQLHLAGVFDPIVLERAEIVATAKLRERIL